MMPIYTSRRHHYLQEESIDRSRTSLDPYLKKISSRSYIHGIREVYAARTLQEKIFWITVCFICFVAAIYEITQVVIQYNENSIVTKIDIDTMTKVKYPTLLLCPTKWMSRKKVKEFHIDDEVVLYLLSIFESIIPVPLMGLQFTSTLPTKVQSALDRTQSRTLADLALNLSITSDNLHCNPLCCERNSVEKIVTLVGVCFAFDLCESSFQSREKSPHFLLQINTTDSETRRIRLVNGGYLALYENKQQISKDVHDVIVLTADTMSVIKLGLIRIHRISTRKKPCTSTGEVKMRATCEFDCIDAIENKICHNCSKYSMFMENASLPQCAAWLMNTQCSLNVKNKIIEPELEACKARCLGSCQQTVFVVQSVTPVAFPNRHQCGADPNIDCLQVRRE